MKRVWKIMSAVLAASMLAACGSTSSSTASSTASESESTTATAESTTTATEDAITLRLGHTQPTDHQANLTAERFAELVNEYSNGSVTIEIYPNSTFGTAAEMNAAVQSGDLDLYLNASAQFASQYEPITVVDAWYVFENTDHLMKFYSEDCEVYQQLNEGLKEACGIDTLAAIYYGARHMTTETPLNTIADLKGLKMRSLKRWAPPPPPLPTTKPIWLCSRAWPTVRRTPPPRS